MKGFRLNRSCMDNEMKLCKADWRIKKRTFFLYIQKVYDTVWWDGLSLKIV